MSARQTKARYAPGLATFEEIVRAAEQVLVESGHAALSLRRVAEECGLKIGNLSYYFPAKHDLIKALLDSIIVKYQSAMDQLESIETRDPRSILEEYMFHWMRGNEDPRTSRIYTEIWSMGNNDAHVREELTKFYAHGQQRVGRILARINPDLSEAELGALALFTISTMEGLMVFANKEQSAWSQMPRLAAYATRSVLDLVETKDRRDLEALMSAWSKPNGPSPLPTTGAGC